jgi:DtxR family Mn-dependent transcriptional regulator
MLTPEEADDLEMKLGYPATDPHGDPIPSARSGRTHLAGRPLADWPLNKEAEIVHIEDEPESVFTQIISEGLFPGTDVIVKQADLQGLRVSLDDGSERWLAPMVAANIFVAPASSGRLVPTNAPRLSSLRPGQAARVLSISPEVRGLTRRRFLDLGITSGTAIEAELSSAFGGDPTAYRVRGTLIALRREQADRIFIEF